MSNKLKYVKVYDQIFEMIQNQTFPPGSRLPSEKDLSEQMKVSRMTLRKALALLQEDDLITNKTGIGSFVNTPEPVRAEQDSTCLCSPVYKCCTQDIDQVELDFRIEPPTGSITKMLEQRSAVVVITNRWYKAQSRPCAYSLSFVPIEVIVEEKLDLNDTEQLLLFLQEGIYQKSSRTVCTFVHSTAGNFASSKYTLSETPSFMLVQENIYGEQGRLLTVSKHYIPIDSFKMELRTDRPQH